ncbi:MAG: hypothetical protein WAQ98_03620 [Blastocatellia bacterium]
MLRSLRARTKSQIIDSATVSNENSSETATINDSIKIVGSPEGTCYLREVAPNCNTYWIVYKD